jgi:hypothetical protein
MRRVCVVVTVALLALVGLSPPATAATLRGQWGMRPVHGMVDDLAGNANLYLSGGWTGVPGAVGQAVRFRWTGRPAAAAVHGGAEFNPGTADFAVAVYLKADKVPALHGYSPNVVQKGHFDDQGQWKMEVVHTSSGTVARCRFAGTRGHRTVLDHTATALNDNGWHKVICWRGTSAYGISVDGALTSVHGTVGAISNPEPMRVAAKGPGAGVTDQFQGTVDCVAYVQGSNPLRLAKAAAPC